MKVNCKNRILLWKTEAELVAIDVIDRIEGFFDRHRWAKNGLIAVLGFWITQFFMEWIVFGGFMLPKHYAVRVMTILFGVDWLFTDPVYVFLLEHPWFAMVLDYMIEGSIAFITVASLTCVYNHLRGDEHA